MQLWTGLAKFSRPSERGSDLPLFVTLPARGLAGGGRRGRAGLDAAEQNGVPVVTVTETLPEGSDFLTWMGNNLDSLDRASST